MRILITLSHLGLGGTESYSVTVGEQLERLGHSVTISAPTASPEGRELVSSRGLGMRIGDPGELDDVDALLAQDAASSYLVAERRLDIPQVFVIHGFASFEHPPRGLASIPPAVVLNDRVARHVAAVATPPEVVRLRQPIDLERFRPRGARRPSRPRVLILSNNLGGERMRALEGACADLGLELGRVGVSGAPTPFPENPMAESDIVVGYGRSVLEGMATGCAAYVWDHAGGDGWVTPESYPTLESEGFNGAATDELVDSVRLRDDLSAYRPEMGEVGSDLVRLHHSATEHAEDLVGLLERSAAPQGGEALESLSLLVRAEYRASNRIAALSIDNQRLRREREGLYEERDALQGRLADVERQRDDVLGSRTWRMFGPWRRLAARLRGGGGGK